VRRFALAYVYIIRSPGLFDLSADDALPAADRFLPRDFRGDVVDTFIRPQHDRSWLRESRQKREPLPPSKRKLSIIVPAYNESHNIDQVVPLCRR